MPRLDLEGILHDFMMHATETELDEEAEQRLVQLARAGDEGAKREIMLKNLRGNLVICREFATESLSVSDMLVVASRAVLEAAEQHNRTEHGPFRPFARRAARHALAIWSRRDRDPRTSGDT